MQDSVEKIILADSNQVSLAVELGIVLEEGVGVDSVVLKINQALAGKSIEEQARWFVLSVFRHLTSGQWLEPAASNLDLPRQYSLAQACLVVDGFKKSMTTVLKDRRTLFTLLRFGKSKDAKKNIISSTTKAYKISAAVLKEQGLLQTPEQGSNRELAEDLKQEPYPMPLASKADEVSAAVLKEQDLLQMPEQESNRELAEDLKQEPDPMPSASKADEISAAVAEEDDLLQLPEQESSEEQAEDSNKELAARVSDNTAANRRAGRRGYFVAELNSAAIAHSSEKIAARKDRASSMSEKEFLDLEAAIENSTQKPVQQEWSYRSNEDRWSLILGLAAGIGFFSLILILFL